jgi:hypothetical protein
MMPLTKFVRNSTLIVCCVSLFALSGCYDPYYVGGGAGYQVPYGRTVVSYQEPWYDYDYYPSSGVYFNSGTGYYYHHDHGRWNQVRRLPRHIRIHDYDKVRMRLHGDRPYLYYDEHRRKYRGHRNKNKHKNRKDRYRDERKYEKRYRREYKDEMKRDRRDSKHRNKHDKRQYKDARKHDRHSGGSGKKRNKQERDRDDREYSSDRQRRNKKDKKKRQYKKKQRKLAEKQQEREYRRQAIDGEINAIQTRVYGGANSDDSSRNSGWTIQ